MFDRIPPEQIDDHAELGERNVWGARLSECFLHPGEVPEHAHPHDGLALLLGGSLEEQLEGRRYRWCAGQVMRQFRERPHSLRVGGGGAHVFRIRFRREADLPAAAPMDAPAAALPLMQRLYALFAQPGSHETTLAAWALDAEHCLKRESRRNAVMPRWLADAEHLIGAQGPDANLLHITDSLGVSRARLNRVFHHWHGCNPSEWLRRRRVFSACQRLRTSHAPIAQIAQELGYADQAHFSRTFKQGLGMSPLRYRQLGNL